VHNKQHLFPKRPQVWVKTPEVLTRDRLAVAYQIRPAVARLKSTLVGLGGAGSRHAGRRGPPGLAAGASGGGGGVAAPAAARRGQSTRGIG
jgi:hypothetical protein